MGGHPNRIPVSEIAAYAALNRFGLFKAQDLLKFVDAMDRVYIDWFVKKKAEEEGKRAVRTPQNQKSAPAAPPPSPRSHGRRTA